MRKALALWLALLVACCFIIPLQAAPLERPAVMAPLEVNDWTGFVNQLQQAKAIGIVAVSTDVWWGKVEGEADQQFDWGYYDRVSDTIIDAGLKWVPIFSFHQCGGNVGDNCDIPIPTWLWSKLGGEQPDKLKYKSEKGHYSTEVIALWADDIAREQYTEFIQAFADHFEGKSGFIEEINISAGPSGELRYPSYNQHDGFRYPERGFLQSYSDAAQNDFRRFIKERYKDLDGVKQAWGGAISTWEDIRPPSDADGFFSRQDYLNIQYGRDFIEWYNQALLDHGEFMLNVALANLNDNFSSIPLGIKVPGIHWLMDSPEIPRSAEISAGLIPTHIDISSEETAHGYAPLIAMVKEASDMARPVVLHFTCLEMDNTPSSPDYSLAKDLVFWVAGGADSQDLTIMGENALSDGITKGEGWDNIDNAIQWSSYKGLTTLRLKNLADNDGFGFKRYQHTINEYGSNSLSIENKED